MQQSIKALTAVVAVLFCAGCSETTREARQAAGGDPAVRQFVAETFPDAPIMLRIAQCESGMRQFGPDGRVLSGAVHPPDKGVFQINTRVHGPTAHSRGVDLHMTRGNIAFTRYLYDKEGTRPWLASKGCWGKDRYASR